MFGARSLLLLLVFVLVLCCPAHANVQLPLILSDNMVVQRDKPVPIWGRAEPGELVGIKFGEQGAIATANKDGYWTTTLKPMQAGGPFEMTIHGKNEITLKNIMVGEVWLCAGQSNIGIPFDSIDHTDQDAESAKSSEIRLFTVNDPKSPKPAADTKARSAVCSPETVQKFSGIGALFAFQIYGALKVPVGIVVAAHGGAPIETFISRKSIDASNEYKGLGTTCDRLYDEYNVACADYQNAIRDWPSKAQQAKVEGKQAPSQPVEPEPPRMKVISSVFQNVVSTITPFAFRGIVFYQGESDLVQPARYRKLFGLMVQDWRDKFRSISLPLIYVQLPNFGRKQAEPEESLWAILREAQSSCRRIPYTYMVVTVDTAAGASPGMHPGEKREISMRLARTALATQYHLPQAYASPIYDAMEVQGNKIRINFRYADKGLVSKGLPVRGFQIAGEDQKFVWASAQVDGDTVVVSNEKIDHPVAVRYGWSDNPQVNLYNADKLPVSPFRTDTWPIKVGKLAVKTLEEKYSQDK